MKLAAPNTTSSTIRNSPAQRGKFAPAVGLCECRLAQRPLSTLITPQMTKSATSPTS